MSLLLTDFGIHYRLESCEEKNLQVAQMGAQNRLRQKKHQEKAASGSVTAGVAEQLQYKLQQHKQLHSLQLLMLLLPDPNYNILKVCSLHH